MAALSAVLRLAPAGSHVVAGDDLYGGTSRLLERVAPGLGIEVSNVDTCDVDALKAALRPGKTSLVMLESPTNPRMQVCDIGACAAAAHAVGALVAVDNSTMAPTFQRPLALGADLSVTSATKFLNGHSDVMAGTVAVKGKDLGARIAFLQNAEGAGLAPFDCWLTLRGLKTMDLRMRAAATNAAALAAFLDGHPLVEKVLYPGLASHPGAALHAAQATSAGSLLSFTTGK
jgi:cysteine-S-conjugate beta-lyase